MSEKGKGNLDIVPTPANISSVSAPELNDFPPSYEESLQHEIIYPMQNTSYGATAIPTQSSPNYVQGEIPTYAPPNYSAAPAYAYPMTSDTPSQPPQGYIHVPSNKNIKSSLPYPKQSYAVVSPQQRNVNFLPQNQSTIIQAENQGATAVHVQKLGPEQEVFVPGANMK